MKTSQQEIVFTKKTSWSIIILVSIVLGACVNAPQRVIETDDVEITEGLINAIHRYRDIEPFHNGYALVIHDSIDDGKVHFGYINLT